MAKKEQINKSGVELVEELISTGELVVENKVPKHKVDPIVEKVRNLRSKGFDDNRIAAMLMIHKQTVQNIK